MKRLTWALCGVLVFMFCGCPHITTPVKDCGAETAVGLVDDVNRVLATGDWQSGVANLIADFGECVIRKVLERIAGDDTRAQHDDLAALQQRRARAWLDAHPGP